MLCFAYVAACDCGFPFVGIEKGIAFWAIPVVITVGLSFWHSWSPSASLSVVSSRFACCPTASSRSFHSCYSISSAPFCGSFLLRCKDTLFSPLLQIFFYFFYSGESLGLTEDQTQRRATADSVPPIHELASTAPLRGHPQYPFRISFL